MDLWLPPKPAIILPDEPRRIPLAPGLIMLARNAFLMKKRGGAPISFVASASNNTTTAVNLAVTMPGAVQGGDTVLSLYTGLAPGAGVPLQTGYTQITSASNLVGCLKQMGGTPDSTASYGTSPTPAAAIVMAFRNVGGAFLNAIGESTGAPPNPPSVTPTLNGCVVIAAGGAVGIVDTTPGTVTGYSTPINEAGNTGGGSSDRALSACYKILVGGAGVAEDPPAWSSWTTGTTFLAASIVLEPAP